MYSMLHLALILTEQARSKKDLLYGFWKKNYYRTQASSPERVSSTLPTPVANHSTAYIFRNKQCT